MHIPDNYLSPATCAALGLAMVPIWSLSLRRVRAEVPRERLPLLGVGAALAFVLMLFNVPLPGGSTGHALGATLLAVFFGPWAACLALSVALLIQALLFGDGGILALGANCLNMAFAAPFVGYYIAKAVAGRHPSPASERLGLALGAYAGLNVAALCAAIELGLQPLFFHDASGLPRYCPYPLALTLPAMALPHLLVAGVVDAAFSVAILTFVRRASPDLLQARGVPRGRPLLGLLGVLATLSPLGLLAAGTAWGEWAPEDVATTEVGGKALGFIPSGMVRSTLPKAPLDGYGLAGMPPALGYLLSAVAGMALLVIAFKLLAKVLSRPTRTPEA